MTSTAVAATTTTTTPTTSTNSTTQTSTNSSSQLSSGNGLTSLADNFQDFLSLLTTQLQNQDPLNPTDTDQFTEQITQMTGVQQQLLTNNLLQSLVSEQTSVGAAANLLGDNITASGATSSDPAISGTVTGIENVDGTTMLQVGSSTVALSSVTSVSQNTSNSLASLLGE
ncbi:MAG TPA: flagellar hook capping FlgD N-terminal domain-containing protein [Caulobacteraceae bacterium]|nr:flagellar hook capping FlgD N-terminal domain-containing protein [Caulobacteraceae bacterium]